MKTVRIFFYDEGSVPHLKVDAVADSLRRELPNAQVEIRGEFVRHHAQDLDLAAETIAAARLRHERLRTASEMPLVGEVAAERRILDGAPADGAVYDAFLYQDALRRMLSAEESRRSCLHVAVTNRLMAQWWDAPDNCYYGVTVVCGNPSVVSIPGCYEGPGVPPGFRESLTKNKATMPSHVAAYRATAAQCRDQMVFYGDDRITAIVMGMVWQAVFYHFFGEAFCEDATCRLFNAHQHVEMCAALLPDGGRLCEKHARKIHSMPQPIFP
jgi:hypothetical protein